MPPSLSLPSISLRSPSFNLGRRRSSADVVGLDVQPGFVAAVKARVNGSILAERAAALPLESDTVREGEVVDVEALAEALRELFSDGNLGKRVRVGIANQRTVMRTLELPPVTDRKELAAVVKFQAQDQVPMPLSNAVLDFHPLGIHDTPTGPRQRVVLVAAQRDMVERLLAAVSSAGLTAEGVDLSAFALIRSLHDRAEGQDSRVLYLNIDGLTNLAIAEGTECRFTRVIGAGVEGMAVDLAARRAIPLAEARTLLGSVDLNAPVAVPQAGLSPADAPNAVEAGDVELDMPMPEDRSRQQDPTLEQSAPLSREEHEAREVSMGYAETIEATHAATTAAATAADATAAEAQPAPSEPVADDADIRAVLENSVREIAGEVRNSLDFHRTQEQGGEVSHISVSGAVLDLPGFVEALQASLGMEVRSEAVGLADVSLAGRVSTHRLAVAAGLATSEAPR
jgi:type IV pilus assembly protein PilM